MTVKTTTRRHALLAGTGLLASSLAAPAIAQGAPRVLRMATSWNEGLRGLSDSAQRVADTITRGSRGTLEVRVGWAGAFVAPLSEHEAVGNGDIDLYHSAEYYFQKRHPALNFFTTVPFGLTTPEQAAWLSFGGGQALWDELNAKFGVRSFAVGGTGTQMLGWFAKDLNAVDDLNGLRIRMPGLASQVLARFGAEVVALPGSGIIEGMLNGSLDAAEWVGPANDRDFGLQKLAQRYYYPGFQEPGMMASLGVNLDLWDSLSDQEKSLIKMTCEAELTLHSATYYGTNGLALAKMLKEEGVTPKQLPGEIWDALSVASEQVLLELAETDRLSGRIFNNYDSYRRMVGLRPDLSQSAYLDRRGASGLFPKI
jgi:TRAP-type mannitol/chloroaromatic compound transport system substrate-binding protein